MSILISFIAGLIVLVVLWALNFKAFDAFLITVLFVLIGILIHMVKPFLPGNQPDADQRPGYQRR
jgi:integral membrane sensor domain MASE1